MEFKMKEVGFSTELEFGELQVAGDEQHGFRPFQLMVSSIAVCSGGVLRTILSKKRMEIEDISMKANVTRNEKEANRIEEIHIHYTIKGKDLDESKISSAIELASKNCPMAQSVKDSIKIEETFELV
ncbi:Organic hydroperoxide resistance protein OhrB [Bacillus sp. THAF10]|uniref:OsmC family protein n=1 Tax=Bacillus sp. THAF10 TaxID=2587848 RepID=UPI001269525A|nr:OsmC family protein [Bacillus sp. THAF10]QFT87859.1 Organic hydroperoxide resistance protein OhrB [Bacillus sp. THAF10]